MSPVRIALGYAVLAILWIAFSDAVVTHLKLDPAVMTIKGTVFVFVTASLLYFTIRRLVQTLQLMLTERQRGEEELRRLNRELRAISNCNQALLRATDDQSLVKEICRIVCDEAGYRMAWVGYAEHDEAKSVRPVAWAGAEEGYLATAGITWADTDRGRGPAGTAICSGTSCYIQDYATDPRFAPWRESALQRGFRCGIVLPLKDEHAMVFGCLCIYAGQPNAFTSEEIRLLEELAGDLAFGIVTLRSAAARRKAEQEVNLLSFALDNVRETAFLMDDRARFHYVNEEACRVLGYTRAELLGMAVPDIDPDFPADRWAEQWRNLQTQRSLSFESQHRTRDGRVFPVEISTNYFEYGGRAYHLALVRDITERKRAKQEARSTAAQWQATFDAVQDLVLLLDKDCRIVRANCAAARFLELPLDKIVGAHCYGLIHGTSTPPAECPLARMRQSRQHEEAEVLARKGGPWLLVSADPLFDPSGELTQVVHVARDITERKRAEEERRESAERFRAIADYTYDWENWVGNDGALLWVNPAVERITGYTVDACMAMPGFPIPIVADADRETVARQIREAVQGSSRNDFEFRVRHKDGRLVWVAASWQPIYDSRGARLGHRSSIRDIGERKQAEEALRRSEAYLAEAQRLTHTGSWVRDETGEMMHLSEELYRIFGLDPQEGLPSRETLRRLVHPDDVVRAVESVEKALREKTDTFVEYRIVLPDGSVKHLQVIRHPILNDAGDILELVGTAIDITDRKRDEEALRQSEAYLAEAQRLSHTGSFAFDVASNKYLYVSEECSRIFEFDPHERPTREEVSRLIHPEDWDRVKGDFEKLLREKVDTSSEFRITLPSGTVKHIRAIRHPLLNDAGEAVTVLGTVIDNTERTRAEEALRRSEAYLRETQKLALAGSWVWDPINRKFLYASDEMLRLYGFDPGEGIPTPDRVLERIHPDDRDKIKHTRTGSADVEFDYRYVLPDGALRHFHCIAHPVVGSSGEVREVLGIALDITDAKRAEEALREGETRFRTFVDHAADAFFMLDFDQSTIIDVNRCACVSLGYTREELIGMTPLAFDVDLNPATLEAIAEQAAAGETVVFDRHRHRRKDGSLFPVEIQTSLFWHGGRRFLLKAARDISDRVRAEEQRDRLRQLETELAHINRVSMMGELTASIAHEIGQPLSGVVSNGGACLRWLGRDVPNVEEAREAAKRIVRDGKRAGEIIARIRAMTKKAATPNEKVALNGTIQDVLALVGDEAKRKSVIVRTQFADELAPVVGDRVQFQQVALNLVLNGLEAMSSVADRPRELVITTRNVDPDQVQVTVEDSGAGLDPTAMDKIFDPFYTTKPTGMGMGLAICHSILQAHGGRLWAEAKDGPGTMFHFTLPKYQEGE